METVNLHSLLYEEQLTYSWFHSDVNENDDETQIFHISFHSVKINQIPDVYLCRSIYIYSCQWILEYTDFIANKGLRSPQEWMTCVWHQTDKLPH